MNLIDRYYQRSQELRQVELQLASYETAKRELLTRADQLRAQLAELDSLIADVQAAEAAAPTTERLGEAGPV